MKLTTRHETGTAPRAGRVHEAEVVVMGEAEAAPVVIEQARQLAAEAADHARRGCRAALLAGLRLIWLHRETASQGARNDLRDTCQEVAGFEGACEQIGVNPRTAYRWMNATAAALMLAGEIETPGEVSGACPEPGSDGWRGWEGVLIARAEGMSLRRLQVGWTAERTDFHRLAELLAMAEAGSDAAAQALDGVDSGRLTLAQAIRAATGAEATRGKERRDPVYLEWDPVGGKLKGLLPAALRTAGNAFSRAPERRDEVDDELAIELVNAFRAFIQTVPKWVRNFEVK